MRTGGPSGRDVLISSIISQWRRIAVGSVMVAGHQVGEALVPVLIGIIIDRAVSTGSTGDLLRWLTVLAVTFAGLSFCYRFGARFGERAAERSAHNLRIQLTRRVLDPRAGAETGHLSGALVSIATGDAQRVGIVNAALPASIAAVTGLLVGAVALLTVSVPLGLLVLFGAPFLLWGTHLLGRPLERRSDTEQERAAHASGVAADLVAGLRVLKGIGAEPAAIARYRRTSQDSLTATLRAASAKAWHDGGVLALTGIFIALVALVAGRLAAEGDISVGDLIAAVGLAQFLLGPLSIFAWVNAEFAQGRASAGRIASVLATSPAVGAGTRSLPEPVRGQVRFHDVTYGPLRGLTFTAAPGELLGIVVADPAAATAVLRCLGREADPDSGSVELDGVPLSGVYPAAVRAAVLVAAHDAELFEGTLIENVVVPTPHGGPAEDEPAGRQPVAVGGGLTGHGPGNGSAAIGIGAGSPVGADAGDVVEARTGGVVGRALVAAGADEVASSLPNGIDEILAERGRSLSGGQRQRIALARALAVGSPVLAVHDPTTAVDAVTEARIAAGIRDIRRGRTTILITTSPALLAVTDRVVVIDGGTVTADGTHGELVHGHADYRATVLT
ncbi:ABC transporter ATP-binding protein [Protofrankia coriariae]|uniref:Multidrug ABC transporter ATPase n=1 Tax=Protofrankia coriariae TaxID=1562887 RepID=A0ABR5F2I4_9ACTN|nr:ABC transporter ATP-binding protein [Protofrankia coriariae]KLL10916.1 multidrug ABC transporter ATPase [Protofrankia coriariae]